MIETVMLQTIIAVALWCGSSHDMLGIAEQNCRERLLACLSRTNDTQERLKCFKEAR